VYHTAARRITRTDSYGRCSTIAASRGRSCPDTALAVADDSWRQRQAIAGRRSGTRAKRPSAVDVELVTPRLELAEATPPPPLARGPGGAAQGGDRIIEPVPVRPTDPVRPPPRVQRRAQPAPHPMVADPAAPPAGDPDRSEPPAGDATHPAAEAAGAEGDGDGNGTGDGAGAIDLSSRPVPLDTAASQVLPYTAEALRDRIIGDVQLALMVDPLGRVGRVTVRRGLGHGLDEIASRIALKIRFRPARDRAGKPTAGTVRWRFHFQAP
jgi:TonB family protein